MRARAQTQMTGSGLKKKAVLLLFKAPFVSAALARHFLLPTQEQEQRQSNDSCCLRDAGVRVEKLTKWLQARQANGQICEN